MCAYFFSLIFPFKLSAECWINWHLYSHTKGPSGVEGCACQNLILWIVSWCYMCSPWFLCGLWNVFVQKGASSFCLLLLSLFRASFLRDGPSKLCVAKGKMSWVSSWVHVIPWWASALHCCWIKWTLGRVWRTSLEGKLDITYISLVLYEPAWGYLSLRGMRMEDLRKHFFCPPVYLVF